MAVRLIVQKQEEFLGGMPVFTAPDAEGVLFYNDGDTIMMFNNVFTNELSYVVQAQRDFFGTGFKIDYPEPNTNEDARIFPMSVSNSSRFFPARFNRSDSSLVVFFPVIANLSVAAVRIQTAGVGGLV